MLTQPSNAHNRYDPVGVGVQPLSLAADEQSREGESLAEVVIDVEGKKNATILESGRRPHVNSTLQCPQSL